MKEKIVKRGDIFIAELAEVIGSEQGGKRPVLIIQNDIGNSFSPTTIVAPITSRAKAKHKLPTHVHFDRLGELNRSSVVLMEQIRTLDKSRLTEYKGHIRAEDMKKVDKALAVSVGIF